MKNKIEKWYRQGLWTANMVKDATEKGIISSEDYAGIVGEEARS